MNNYYEFFAGGGMARMGLGPQWNCLFSNDFDLKKARIYRENWRDDVFKAADVRKLSTADLPDEADLVWASFPCQDLSLAGGGAGLKGDRSGTFWPFWKLMETLGLEVRAPKIIVLENVCGMLSSHEGKDFAAVCEALRKAGYRAGGTVVDAKLFIPHSRPRLFIIAIRHDLELPSGVFAKNPSPVWHTRTLKTAYEQLSSENKENWIWWNLPRPPVRNTRFVDLIEDLPTGVYWHSSKETRQLLSMMSDVNLSKVQQAKQAGRRMVGAIYKRTRRDENGMKVQRAEVRFDDVAGCLRTPAGGSSRQLIMVIDGEDVKSRLISSRETARLMGLPDEYILPENYNEAYHLTGDGVVVPVVRHLAENVLEPILAFNSPQAREAA